VDKILPYPQNNRDLRGGTSKLCCLPTILVCRCPICDYGTHTPQTYPPIVHPPVATIYRKSAPKYEYAQAHIRNTLATNTC